MYQLKKLLKPLALILLVIVIFSAGYYVRGMYEKRQVTAATQVAHNFIVDMNAGKTDEAYALTGKTIHKNPKSLLMAYLGDLKTTSPKYTDADVYRKGSDVMYVQMVDGLPKTASGQTTGTFSILLHQEGGKWKIATVAVR